MSNSAKIARSLDDKVLGLFKGTPVLDRNGEVVSFDDLIKKHTGSDKYYQLQAGEGPWDSLYLLLVTFKGKKEKFFYFHLKMMNNKYFLKTIRIHPNPERTKEEQRMSPEEFFLTVDKELYGTGN